VIEACKCATLQRLNGQRSASLWSSAYLVFAHEDRAVKVFPIAHVFAVEAAALQRRAEPLEVSRVVRAVRLARHHAHPLGRQDVRRDAVGVQPEARQARRGRVGNAEG